MKGFPQTDRDLFEHIRERANVRPAISWEEIAAELGIKVPDLLDWFLAYREPKRDRDAIKARGLSPMLLASNPGGGADHIGSDARRFANWRKARDGAAKARAGQ